MSPATPPVLVSLVGATRPATRDAAWSSFINSHNKLLLHVARSLGGDYDAVMDRYAYILEQLRSDNFRRLRAFVADGRSEFSTWLVVVAQRICLDHYRHRYGRNRHPAASVDTAHDDDAAARRRLVDLIGADVDLSSLSDSDAPNQEEALRAADTYQALESVLEHLDSHDRLLLKLRFEDDLPVAEIAENLGLPTRFHVYRRLSSVLEKLRVELRRSGITDPVP
jgi:RNA polymerase sigma factor (sigma-70 family)